MLPCRRDRGAPPASTVAGVISSVGSVATTAPTATTAPPPSAPASSIILQPTPAPGHPTPPTHPTQQSSAPATQSPPTTGVQTAPAPSQPSLNIGDMVQVAAQESSVRQMQRGHGEWADSMKQVSALLLYCFLASNAVVKFRKIFLVCALQLSLFGCVALLRSLTLSLSLILYRASMH